MSYVWQMILVVSLASALLRFTPFIIFGTQKEVSPFIMKLGNILPRAVMGLLVVYCLKDVSIVSGSHGIPEAIAIIFVAGSYAKTKNNLISIFGGTLIYLLLVNYVF